MMSSRGLSRSARTISIRWRSPTLKVETIRRGIELELVGLEHPVELGEEFARRQARVEAKGDVLQDRHRLEQREVLEHHADAEAPRGARGSRSGSARRRK